MEELEKNEVGEVKPASPLETFKSTEALELTGQTDSVLTTQFESLSASAKLEMFRALESKCAEIEGRAPRAVFASSLEGETFKASMESVEIDEAQLSELGNLDEARLSDLKKHVFSEAEIKLNRGSPVSFGRSCSQKCIDNDVKSGDCRYG